MSAQGINPWANHASAPSMSRDRGLADTRDILGKLGVPECAQVDVATRIATNSHRSDPILVTSNKIVSPQMDYLPVMDMSFRKEGVDYVDRVNVDVYEPFVARAYRYRCDGQYGAVAYMPKCQNLAPLEIADPEVGRDIGPYLAGVPGLLNFNDGGGGGGTIRSYDDDGGVTTNGTIPEPSVLTALVAGLLAFMIVRKRRAKNPLHRPGRDVC